MSRTRSTCSEAPDPPALGVGDKVILTNGSEGEVVFIDANQVSALVRIFGPRGAAIVNEKISNLRRVEHEALSHRPPATSLVTRL
jgi:hypothetical protein